MERFDWQTDEEGPIEPAAKPTERPFRKGLMATVVILLMVAFVSVVFWQLGLRAAIRDQTVKDDVLAAYGIWQQAVARRDEDMLSTLLMDGEATWTATQRELLVSGRSLDRPAIGLALMKDWPFDHDIPPEVKVSRDWRTAEVTFPVMYSTTGISATYGVVGLEQIVSLVREGSHWLLRRPAEEFWGEWRTATGNVATISYRERDTELAEQFLTDLDRDLEQVCARAVGDRTCPDEAKVHVRMESDTAILLKVSDQNTPTFSGRTFVIPSPTLVGQPLDVAGYRVLYMAYSSPILKTFKALLGTPIRFPEQNIAIICYDRDGKAPGLFRYDPELDSWTEELKGNAFRFLVANEDDSRIALRQHIPGEPNRLRIVLWTAGHSRILYDKIYAPLTSHAIGWVKSMSQDRMLLTTYQGTMREPSYQLFNGGEIEPDACPDSDCQPLATEGFPIWSADGTSSLLDQNGQIELADRSGRVRANLGEGNSPFWLDNTRYGFVRPLASQYQFQEVVVGATGKPGLDVLWSTADLDPGKYGLAVDKPFFIQYSAVGGEGSKRLLLYGRQYAGDQSRYAFLSLPVATAREAGGLVTSAGSVHLELLLDKAPAGIPSVIGPSGPAPFVTSPDGRWLTAANLAEERANAWQIHVVEIGQDRAMQYTTAYPGYSFSHPFFDWSADGHWVLIIDREFIRLVAPDVAFERIIAHDKNTCSYPAWVNRDRLK